MINSKSIKNAQKYGLVQPSLRKRYFDPHTETVELPRLLKIEDCEEFESCDRYRAYLKAGFKVKVSPQGDRYVTTVYKSAPDCPVYGEILDKNYRVLRQFNYQY